MVDDGNELSAVSLVSRSEKAHVAASHQCVGARCGPRVSCFASSNIKCCLDIGSFLSPNT